MLRAGVFLQDRYEILERIGSGGMSDVYKAKCHKLNRMVAVKVLKEEFCSDEGFISKFKMEAQSAARLAHPNIVSVYDVVDEGVLHYIVMELVEGITLKNYIAKKGHLDVQETIGIAIQVAQGIAAAHDQNIIHRDIKPQNIIISRDGKVKVTDFGIAKAVSSQTMSTTAIGSVHYISPEQARGGYSDARSDIYSLGITMYEMITGRVPFEGDNTVTVALAHLEEPITPPGTYNSKIPVSLEKIILKSTEKKPEFRYNTAVEVINDLRHALIEPDVDFVKMVPGIDTTAATVTISEKELAQIRQGSGKKDGEAAVPYVSEVTRTEGPAHTEERQKHQPDQAPAAEPEIKLPFEDEPARAYREEPVRGTKKKQNSKRKRKVDDEEDVNPQIEKILTGLGIFVAILFVAGLIFLFAKVGGLFKMGFTKDDKTTVAVEETSEAMDDTKTEMPPVEGLTIDEAEAKLKEKNLVMKVREYQESEEIDEGIVISQEKAAGSSVEKYSTVYVIVSKGSGKINLMELGLEKMDEAEAAQLLTDKKLAVTIERENSESIEQGKVIRFSPEKAAEGESVVLVVSNGSENAMTTVPNLVGETEEEAIALLAEAGLVPGTTNVDTSNTVPKGSVMNQEAPAGTAIARGSAIGYVVSSGPTENRVRYVAAINETYDLSTLVGPGSGSVSLEVTIRLKQIVNGAPEYTPLMPATEITGSTLLPISFSNIEGAPGVQTGELEIINVDTGAVIKTYPLTFFPQE
ncbi:Stk1 family PASTA domain-containing Ser/Thr kinase [Clostridium sp. AM58-1XD]|uniref:Stk1 family PASTA domain-containing Ser/Thr kinase n=1 Tax=Clostridium sp. AM58-1XD TaxID=2292307 RepID=UPI000E5302A1|nr:Stk1 family PASTA domain-containing Ser/Thr kinase [Clostridium sp. AM58-1XD]RGY99426.1 Stk1 family PASTA domain-containing Ser/Thr kinase [Clostridium sp. AM58-1XD]